MSTAPVQSQASRIGSHSVWSQRANRDSAFATKGARSGVADRGPRVPSAPGQPPGARKGSTRSVAREAPALDWLDLQLLDACRRDFPICERPFAEIARRLSSRADEVLRRFEGLERCGVVNWIGPALAAGSVGASTQVAMAVPKARLRSVRESMIRYRGVNHICEREHEFNLWFALEALNAGELYDAVADIRQRTGVAVLDLRPERDYCEDVEFPSRRRTPSGLCRVATETPPPLDESDRRLLAAIREGLSLTARPYAMVAKRVGISERQVIERLKCLLSEGLIARMETVARHHSPGLAANALVVFDVSRHAVDLVGERLAGAAWIDQCHRCIQRAPIWPYNLYCALHDQDLAKLINWVDKEFFGTVRCPRRAVLLRGACYGDRQEN